MKKDSHGGDYNWSNRAVESGLTIEFVEDAKVLHPTRKSFEQILKKEQRIAFGQGNHYKINNKPYFLLVLKYFLKIFKIDTNIKNTIKLRKKGIAFKDLVIFNIKFFKIRLEQLKYAKKGYKTVDGQKIGLR